MSTLKSLSALVLSSFLLSACATSPPPHGKIKINYSPPEYRESNSTYSQKQQTQNTYSKQKKEVDLRAEAEIMRKKFEELNQHLIKITK